MQNKIGAGLTDEEKGLDSLSEQKNLLVHLIRQRLNSEAKDLIYAGLDISEVFLIESTPKPYYGYFINALIHFDNFELFADLINHLNFDKYFITDEALRTPNFLLYENQDLGIFSKLLNLSILCHWIIKHDRPDILEQLSNIYSAFTDNNLQSLINPGNKQPKNLYSTNGIIFKFSSIHKNHNQSAFKYKLKYALQVALLNITIPLDPLAYSNYMFEGFETQLDAYKIDARKLKKSLHWHSHSGILAIPFCYTLIMILPIISTMALLIDLSKPKEERHNQLGYFVGMPMFLIIAICMAKIMLQCVGLLYGGREKTVIYALILNAYNNLLLADLVKEPTAPLLFRKIKNQAYTNIEVQDIELTQLPTIQLAPT